MASPVLQLRWPRRWHVGSMRMLCALLGLQKLRELALCDTHTWKDQPQTGDLRYFK